MHVFKNLILTCLLVRLYWPFCIAPNAELFCHSAAVSHSPLCHPAILPYCHSAIFPFAILPFRPLAIFPFCQFANLPFRSVGVGVQEYKDKSQCYECGEGGHLSYECPKNMVRGKGEKGGLRGEVGSGCEAKQIYPPGQQYQARFS